MEYRVSSSCISDQRSPAQRDPVKAYDRQGTIPAVRPLRRMVPSLTVATVDSSLTLGAFRSAVIDRRMGSLILESAFGKGSTFFIRLPLELGDGVVEANAG